MAELFASLQALFADRYTIERELGRGGMATVYLAEELKHHRRVAIKVLRPDLAAALGPERFLREIEIAGGLQHAHMLTLIDSGSEEGFLYYVMPYVEGESLRGRLDREKQLPIDDALEFTSEVADALSYTHTRGVLHRDIKPENILLSGGHAIVADFGIARAISVAGEGRLIQTGVSLGTPAYMSPEQGTGSGQLDARSDIYSLGCVLYEMLAGDPPFTGTTAQAIVARHLVDPPPRLRTVRQTVSPAVEQALEKALAKVPADRFATAAEFAEALAVPGSKATLRVPRAVLSTVALLVVTALVVGWLLWVRPNRFSTAAGGGAPLKSQRIAVLFFHDRSPTHELAYLADGLTQALIDTLRRVQNLNVISSSGVRPYKNASISADSIARALNVAALIEGEVANVGGKFRTTIWLVDGATGPNHKGTVLKGR